MTIYPIYRSSLALFTCTVSRTSFGILSNSFFCFLSVSLSSNTSCCDRTCALSSSSTLSVLRANKRLNSPMFTLNITDVTIHVPELGDKPLSFGSHLVMINEYSLFQAACRLLMRSYINKKLMQLSMLHSLQFSFSFYRPMALIFTWGNALCIRSFSNSKCFNLSLDTL